MSGSWGWDRPLFCVRCGCVADVVGGREMPWAIDMQTTGPDWCARASGSRGTRWQGDPSWRRAGLCHPKACVFPMMSARCPTTIPATCRPRRTAASASPSPCTSGSTRPSTGNTNPIAANTNKNSSKRYTNKFVKNPPSYDTAPEKRTSSSSNANTTLTTPEAGPPDPHAASPNQQYHHQSFRSVFAGAQVSHPAGSWHSIFGQDVLLSVERVLIAHGRVHVRVRVSHCIHEFTDCGPFRSKPSQSGMP